MRPLISLLATAAFAQWDNRLLRPFTMNHREGGGSLADVSFLLDAPAGKDGFVRIQNGHLLKPDGQRLRLLGVHLTDWSPGSILLPAKEDSAMFAAKLARFAVNCVWLHFLDLAAPRGIIDASRDNSRAFDSQQLDRLDYLFAELKKSGIYADLNLSVGRSYKAGDCGAGSLLDGWQAVGPIRQDASHNRLPGFECRFAVERSAHARHQSGWAAVADRAGNGRYPGAQSARRKGSHGGRPRRLRACSGERIRAKKTSGGWELAIGDPVTPWYVISVRR